MDEAQMRYSLYDLPVTYTMCLLYFSGLTFGPVLVIYSSGIMIHHSDTTANILLQFVFLGSAISPTFGCPLMQLLIDSVGWRGAIRVT